MKEWQRTLALLVLLGILIAMFVWLRSDLDNQALKTLR